MRLCIELDKVSWVEDVEIRMRLTAVKYDSATIRALAFRLSFISLISLSTSSMNLESMVNELRIGVLARCSLNDEIDDLVFEHRFGVGVSDKERDVIALS